MAGTSFFCCSLPLNGVLDGDGALRGGARPLHAGVHVALVVVAHEQEVVAALGRPRQRLDADVGRAAVARPADHLDVILALGLQRLEHAGGRRGGGGEGHIEAGQLGGGHREQPLQHGEAAGRHHEDGVRPQGLQPDAVGDAEAAAGAGPVAGMDVLFFGEREDGGLGGHGRLLELDPDPVGTVWHACRRCRREGCR